MQIQAVEDHCEFWLPAPNRIITLCPEIQKVYQESIGFLFMDIFIKYVQSSSSIRHMLGPCYTDPVLNPKKKFLH
jgi:hypothetical protein